MGHTEPQGIVRVEQGGSLSIDVFPDDWFFIDSVSSNGVFLGPVTNLYWSNITEEGFVEVRFLPEMASGGTPLWWLAEKGLTNSAVSFDQAEITDTDADGFSNAQEWICNTEPDDNQSFFEISGLEIGPAVKTGFTSSEDRMYRLYQTDGLRRETWREVEAVMGTGGPLMLPSSVIETNSIKGFFKLSVELLSD